MSEKKDNEFELKFNQYRHDGEHHECPICGKKKAMLWGRCTDCGSSLSQED